MESNFTLQEIVQFYHDEVELLNPGIKKEKEKLVMEDYVPKEETVKHILNFSRALEIQNSDELGDIELISN